MESAMEGETINNYPSQVWWYIPAIPALRRLT
jgi:hypothetical protein